jgi:hypothetical protein
VKGAITSFALIASVASAQETGTLIQHAPSSIDYHDPNAARLSLWQFGRCMVSKSQKRTLVYVGLPLGSEAERKMAGAFLSGENECLSGNVEDRRLSFPLQLMRGSIFDAQYIARFGRKPVPDLTKIAPIDYAANEAASTSDGAQAVALARFGDCVVRKAPAAAQSLLKSTPGSSVEDGAFRDIGPALGPCLTNGQQFRFSKSLLRGAIAEPLYRLSEAAGTN